MLSAIIFDFDGVIVDSHAVHMQAWKELLRSKGKPVSDQDLEFVREGAKRDEILRRFMGELTAEQVERYGAEKQQLVELHFGELRLVNGCAVFLAETEAAGLPMAVASSGSRKRVEETLRRFGLQDKFRAIVTADDVRKGKPDPELFQLAAQRLAVEKKNILVCEDAVAGVVAAKNAGMRCMAIAAEGREELLKAAGADLIVPDFTHVTIDLVRSMFVPSRSAAAL